MTSFNFGLVPKTSNPFEEMKEQVQVGNIAAFLMDVHAQGKVECVNPDHTDDTPSLQLYDEGAYCFGCDTYYDVFTFLSDYMAKFQSIEEFNAGHALAWFRKHREDIPAEYESVSSSSSPRSTRSAVSLETVQYWHSLLVSDSTKTDELYERLISDETICQLRLGYNPALKCYTIPFFNADQTIVESVQYRSTKDSPLLRGREWKYRGFSNHYHPSLVEQRNINPFLVLIFFGTFDGILASQDGLPAMGLNGASVFTNDQNEDTQWLINFLAGTEKIIIIPDITESEITPAMKMAENVGGEIWHFPKELEEQGIKDFTDFRKAGYSVDDFIQLLNPDWKKFLYLSGELETIEYVYEAALEGTIPLVTFWMDMFDFYRAQWVIYGFQTYLHHHGSDMKMWTDAEKENMNQALSNSTTIEHVKELFITMAEKSYTRMGGF